MLAIWHDGDERALILRYCSHCRDCHSFASNLVFRSRQRITFFTVSPPGESPSLRLCTVSLIESGLATIIYPTQCRLDLVRLWRHDIASEPRLQCRPQRDCLSDHLLVDLILYPLYRLYFRQTSARPSTSTGTILSWPLGTPCKLHCARLLDRFFHFLLLSNSDARYTADDELECYYVWRDHNL